MQSRDILDKNPQRSLLFHCDLTCQKKAKYIKNRNFRPPTHFPYLTYVSLRVLIYIYKYIYLYIFISTARFVGHIILKKSAEKI